ncbi:MAG: cobalamin biosynthesis protein, partial [Pseudomonadota bacterium]
MAAKPAIIALNRSGEPVAHRIAGLLGAEVHGRQGRVNKAEVWFPNALDHARDLFAAGRPVIGVCASGILIRAVAPLLADKHREPPVLSISDDGTVVIPLLGGHRGANRLARQIAEGLGAKAAVTTSGDIALGIALDEPPAGYRLATPEHAKDVMAGLISGASYGLTGGFDWLAPVADLPNVTRLEGPPEQAAIVPFQDGAPDWDQPHLLYYAQTYTVGLGSARNVPAQEARMVLTDALAANGIAQEAIAAVGTLDLKADEAGLRDVAHWLGVPFRLFQAARLEAEAPRLLTPSEVVFAEVGCRGVAEGAALALAGPDAKLVVPKVKSANATCAIAQSPAPIAELPGRSRGRL